MKSIAGAGASNEEVDGKARTLQAIASCVTLYRAVTHVSTRLLPPVQLKSSKYQRT